MKKISIVILIVFGGLLYFATQISATYPPIKEYEFEIPVSDLRIAIKEALKERDKFEYEFTDTVGNKENGYAYYISLRIKGLKMDNYYTIKYEEDEKGFWNKTIISKIKLISAFDKIHNTGGCKSEDTDVAKMTTIFESKFIDKIQTKRTTNKWNRYEKELDWLY